MSTPTPPTPPTPPRKRLKPVAPRSLNAIEEQPSRASTEPITPLTPLTPAQQEQDELANAHSSPLALTFQLVGCAFANASWEKDPQTGEEKVIPTYTFHPPCIRGYAQPNQECRTCAHVRLMPVGERVAFQHRYHGHGMVLPVTEEQAGAIYDAALDSGAKPLGNPIWTSYFAELEAKAKEQREAQERVRQLEEQQRGSFVRRSNGQPGQL